MPRLRSIISRLMGRFSDEEPDAQYEMQWMTFQGGWINFYNQWTDDDEPQTFSTPPETPTFSESTGWGPGRFRCIKRVDGRIDEVVWTTQSPDADSFYQRLRTEHRQRGELAEMSVEEINDALDDGTFDALDRTEVFDVLSEKRAEERTNDNDDDEDGRLSDLEEKIFKRLWEEHDGDPGEAARDTFDKLVELEKVKRGQCSFCHRRYGTRLCSDCGSMACREHRNREYNLCMNCISQMA